MRAVPSISVRILLAVLVTVISVLGISSIIELRVLKHRDMQMLQEQGNLTADRIANSLAYPLWNLNREETERVVLDEISSADVLRIQVFDENGELYVGWARTADGAVHDIARGPNAGVLPPALYSYTRPITFRENNIGRVVVDLTDTDLRAELRKLQWGIAIKLLLVAVILSVVLFVALRASVIRPLSRLRSWVETVPLGSESGPPRFKRSEEISSLGEALSAMSVSLQKKNEELESKHAHLQELNRQMQVEIEERKQAEHRANELAHYLSKMREAVIVTDLNHRFIYWNEGAEHTFGWSAAETLGKTAEELIPDGPVDKLAGPRQSVAETGEWHGELPNVDKDGRKFFTESSWTMVRDARGRPEAIISMSIDITERKQAEDALRASEQRFADLFNLSPYRMGIVRRRDGMILDVNDCWVRETGVPRETAVNHQVFNWEPVIGAEAMGRVRRILDEGKPFKDFQFRFTNGAGDERVTLTSGELVEIDGDSCILWAANDITERERAEQALRESEEIFRTLAETVSAGIYIYRDLQFVYANPAAERLTGYTFDELLKMNLLDMIHPDFRQTVKDRSAARQRGESMRTHFEDKILTKSGEERWMDVTAANTSFLGQPAVIVTTFDITERKRAEEALLASEKRFSVAFNANPALATISRLEDGIFLAVNERFTTLTGYSRAEAVGHTALSLGLWPSPEERASVMQRLKDEGGVRNHEVLMRVKNGEQRVLLLSIETIELEGQTCLLHSGIDITERQRAEVALRTSEEQLRALSAKVQSAREEEGTRIAREIHDELGSALTGLKWDLERMAKTFSQGEHDAAIREARTRIGAMTNLIEATINTVRRISADLRPSILDDLGLVAAIEWQLQQFHSRTGIQYVWNPELETADLNRESATAVFRIFQEILTNVLRHSGAGRITVELQEGGGHLDLKVMDNGRGISEKEKDNARSLGLLGMKERALLVGGEVLIAGAPGAGTTVVVRVPTAA